MSKTKKIIFAVAIVILAIYVYQYPFQKHLALKRFDEYIDRQDIDIDRIAKKEVFKNWTDGGYLIVVNYDDDVNNEYYYNYMVWTNKRGEELKFDRMFLNIVDLNNSTQLDAPYEGKCKYPPIEE